MVNSHTSVATRPAASRWWYAFAVFLFLCGFVFMGAYLVPRVLSIGDDMQQIVVPGVADVTVTKPGTYTIFHERESVVDGAIFSAQTIDGLKVRLEDHLGHAVAVSPTSMSSSYNIGGRSGVSVWAFDARETGVYRLEAGYNDGAAEPRVVLAVGHGFLGNLFSTILAALGFAFAGAIAGVGVAVMTWRSRSRAAA